VEYLEGCSAEDTWIEDQANLIAIPANLSG